MSAPLLPPGFTLHPVRIVEDFPQVVDLCHLAFADSPLERARFPDQAIDPAKHRAWRIQRMEKHLTTDPVVVARLRYDKIVWNAGQPDEELVCVAGWWAPRVGKGVVKSEEEKASEKEEGEKSLPEGARADLIGGVLARLEGVQKVILGEDWEERLLICIRAVLATLATHPGYGRRGLASALVQWGVQQAEAQMKEDPEGPLEGLWIAATPVGLPVYLRNAFREVASITYDLGNGEDYKYVCLTRKLK